MISSSYLQGVILGLSLIMVIGPQNAFILKQGLKGCHMLMIPLFCALADTALIIIGVLGFGELIAGCQQLFLYARWLGGLFLFGYGARCFFLSMVKNIGLRPAKTAGYSSRKKILFILAVLTFLNPYVYIDTVVVLGMLSVQWQGIGKMYFTLGAITASFLWFFSLSYAAKQVAPFLQNPKTWRMLEALIGCVMWTMAFVLILT